MEIVTRQQAKSRGLRRYYTGVPCCHGHLSERWTRGMACVECGRTKTRVRNQENREHENAVRNAWKRAHRNQINEVERVRYRKKRDQRDVVCAGRPRPRRCEVCGRPAGRHSIHFDHNHTTGAFRGWLCNGCNVALGMVDDRPDLLRSLADYLERNEVTDGSSVA